MEMTNVSNQQQTELFKAQQRTQALFTDQAAEMLQDNLTLLVKIR